MDEKTERPELGTTEAAVRSCVNLIALATHTDEEHLAYWLDLYYQTRKAHEKTITPFDVSDLMMKVEAPDPVIVKLDELEARIRDLVNELAMQRVKTPSPDAVDAMTYAARMAKAIEDAEQRGIAKIERLDEAWATFCDRSPAQEFLDQFADKGDGPPKASAPTEETVEAPQPAAPAAPLASSRDAMSEGGSPEAAAAQKKNRAPLTVSERRKLQNAEKEKKRIQGRSDWREFKRATFARLQEARAAGLTVAQIAAASGVLTENTVLDILNAAPRPIEDYRALDAALDRCAAE